jgi:2-keto-4-pentenoate hydratase/2-oxohepta-3-ene-1,7-dioic acid hydratase in catechol pathway
VKLISYIYKGSAGVGAVVGSRVVDLGRLLNYRFTDLRGLLAGNAVGEAAAVVAASQTTDADLAAVQLQPVITNPGQIVCVGLNYGEHVRETNREVTESPTIFLRVGASQVGHRGAIVRPRESTQLDFEGEIAVVIGQSGRRISEGRAWQHIAGYSCYNDATLRDWQKHTGQWTPGKNFWRTGAFGPWLVTADEIAPDTAMTLVTRLNGKEMQRASSDMMIHSIPRLIAYISTFTPLEPGDVIVTGTPGGVGARRTPPVFMQPGDTVEVEVDCIGVLSNPVVAEA